LLKPPETYSLWTVRYDMRLEVYLGFRVLSRPKTDKIIAQYFCLEFILRTMFLHTRLNIIAQYFIPLVGSC